MGTAYTTHSEYNVQCTVYSVQCLHSGPSHSGFKASEGGVTVSTHTDLENVRSRLERWWGKNICYPTWGFKRTSVFEGSHLFSAKIDLVKQDRLGVFYSTKH